MPGAYYARVSEDDHAMSTPRSFSAGQYQFNLDPTFDAAYVKSVDGGFHKAEVVTEQAGPTHLAFKHSSTVDIQPISMELGMAISKPMIDWISASWRRQFQRKSGSIVHADFKGKIRYAQEFIHALVLETTFPALDASNKDSAYMTVKIQPEGLTIKTDTGDLQGSHGVKQKQWTPANFRLSIDGCNCDGVNKIESFTVKQEVKKFHFGPYREPQIEPSKLTFPDLTIESSLAFADDFMKWHHNYVVLGKKDTKEQRDGEIIFYDQSLIHPLLTVKLANVGISAFEILKSEAHGEKIKRAKISLYVESMDITDGFGLE